MAQLFFPYFISPDELTFRLGSRDTPNSKVFFSEFGISEMCRLAIKFQRSMHSMQFCVRNQRLRLSREY